MTRKEIQRLAELSKLEFNETEMAKMEKELSEDLKLILQVKEAQTDGEITIVKVNLKDLREDEVQKSLKREDLLKNAPHSNEQYFVVPQVVE